MDEQLDFFMRIKGKNDLLRLWNIHWMLNVKYLHHKKLINNKTKSLLDRIASNKSYQIKGQCLNDSLTHYYSCTPILEMLSHLKLRTWLNFTWFHLSSFSILQEPEC